MVCRKPRNLQLAFRVQTGQNFCEKMRLPRLVIVPQPTRVNHMTIGHIHRSVEHWALQILLP